MKNAVFWDVNMALAGTDASEEHIASIIKGTNVGELGTKLAVTSNRSTLRRKINSSNTSVLRKVTRYYIPEDDILYYHR
jgi:hypothetical protein